MEHSHERLIKSHQELHEEKKRLEQEKELSNLSFKNMTNELNYKMPSDGKRHILIRSIKQGQHDPRRQHIVLIFDEKYLYREEYFRQKPLTDKEPYIATREINCMVFIDGNKFDPLLMVPISQGEKIAEIESINCGKYTGRRLGTCVIQCLVEVLKVIHIGELYAGLSLTDFDVKDKLCKFYIEYNGFELIKEQTEHNWGHVKKVI